MYETHDVNNLVVLTRKAFRWRKLLCLLSLDLFRDLDSFLDCPIRDAAKLKQIASGVIDRYPTAFKGAQNDEYSQMVLAFIGLLASNFGEESRESFLRWFATVWNELDGPTWDWFAYRFAFSRWFSEFRRSGSDQFCLGVAAPIAANLYQNLYKDRMQDFDEAVMVVRRTRLSAWDTFVFDLAHWRLEETGPEVTGDLFSLLRGPVAGSCFQRYWRLLLNAVPPATIQAIRPLVEDLVKRETSFPGRSLIEPENLPFSPSAFN